MSLRNRIFLPVILSAFGALVGCGGNGVTITRPTPPPSGGFSQSNLNGTYVFSVSGTDNTSGSPYAIVGTLKANGSGGITGGVLDMNDAAFPSSSISPAANVSITSGSYTLGVDGRGQIKLSVSTPFGSSILLDFVLQDSTHGLVTEFDLNASGSGSLDLQSSGTTPTGSYAFILSGIYNGVPEATVGNFALNGAAMAGLGDVNQSGIPVPDQTLSGTFVLGPSSTPSTAVTLTPAAGTAVTFTYDVFAIDANHLKFIEMDPTGTLSGDAFSQSSTTFPTGTLAFTTIGSTTTTVTAAGGFIVTDGNGNITSSSTEDINSSNGTISGTPVGFTGAYSAGGIGRYTLGSFNGFVGATDFVAYPSSGGVLLLEIDVDGMMAGAAYQQTAGATLDVSQGYALNLSGANLSQSVEVDDIAEFATASSGGTLTGVTDENFAPSTSSPIYAVALTGTYNTPDSAGRGQVVATAGNSTTSTLNGGFGINYYAVDGTTFPFIQMDTTTGQISTGVFVKQNSSASSSAATRAHMYVLPPMVRPRIARKQK
jgi:hypothetical protein